jgi:uncharacterized protein HemX
MTPETDENGSDDAQRASPTIAGVSGMKVASWASLATTVVPVALGLVIGIAYLGYANVQRQIKAQRAELQSQHAELQSLKGKIQGMAATQSRTDVAQPQPTQSRTDVDQSQPSISEIQGLQNHVNTLRGQQKQRKK